MPDLTTSIKQFTYLNCAPVAVWTEVTKRKAPHKPILLLAVLDVIQRGVITSPYNFCRREIRYRVPGQ